MKRKRRKVSKVTEADFNEFQLEFITSLEFYDKYVEDKKRNSRYNITRKRWKLNRRDLEIILEKEKKEKLVELYEKYIGIPDHVFHEIEYYVDALVGRFFNIRNLRKRNLEGDNVKEIRSTLESVFEICGIHIPGELILEIISYLHSDMDLINTVGRINSMWYLAVLSNWNSEVIIKSSSRLYQISILILSSVRHLHFQNLEQFPETDLEYLSKHITPKRIQSVRFGVNTNIGGLEKFLEYFKKKKTPFSKCSILYFDDFPSLNSIVRLACVSRVKDKDKLFKSLEDYAERTENQAMQFRKDDFISSVFPNVDTLYNPSVLSSFCNCVKQLPLKNVYFLDEVLDYGLIKELIGEHNLSRLISIQINFHQPFTLFGLILGEKEKSDHQLKELLTNCTSLERLEITVYEKAEEIGFVIPKCLKELFVNFERGTGISSIINPYYTICESLNLSVLGKDLQRISLTDPPLVFVCAIMTLITAKEEVYKENKLENLTHFDLKFTGYFVFDDNVMDGFSQLFMNLVECRAPLLNTQITVFNGRNPNHADFLKIKVSKKFHRLYFYPFTKTLDDTSIKIRILQYLKNIRIVDHTTSTDGRENDYEVFDPRGSLMIKNLYVYYWKNKSRKQWDSVLKDTLPSFEDVAEIREERCYGEMIIPNSEKREKKKWIRYERRNYQKKSIIQNK